RTLCNACGVRYRSGRLFPEYRPAASPTFEASLHSNSHKKVLEIRNKLFMRHYAEYYEMKKVKLNLKQRGERVLAIAWWMCHKFKDMKE
ncbi:GATA transcription factor 9-like protein, partial [Trifolium pratense]